MADIEMMSDLLIGLLHGPQGGSARIIDQYYEQYEPFEEEFPEQSRFTRLFDKTRQTVERLFPDIADVARWGNRADFYSLFVAIGSLLVTHDLPRTSENRIREKLVHFAKDVDRSLDDPTAGTNAGARRYARAIEKGSNDKARRQERHEVLTEIIKPFFRKKK
jgi:hypothetical protein